MEIPLLAGRYLSPADGATTQKVAMVNEKFARHFFGAAQNALGHQVSQPSHPGADFLIIGVVRDAIHTSVRDPTKATVFRPFAQAEMPAELTFYVRTWQSPEDAAKSIGAVLADIDSTLTLDDLSTMSNQIDDSLSNERALALLSSSFGILAMLLAGIGLYGILAYTAAQRTREFGLRMALGAQRITIIGLVFREVMVLVGAAVAVTVPVAVLATKFIHSQLFNVPTIDATVYAMGILVIALIATLAGLAPAYRAISTDPVQTLKTE